MSRALKELEEAGQPVAKRRRCGRLQRAADPAEPDDDTTDLMPPPPAAAVKTIDCWHCGGSHNAVVPSVRSLHERLLDACEEGDEEIATRLLAMPSVRRNVDVIGVARRIVYVRCPRTGRTCDWGHPGLLANGRGDTALRYAAYHGYAKIVAALLEVCAARLRHYPPPPTTTTLHQSPPTATHRHPSPPTATHRHPPPPRARLSPVSPAHARPPRAAPSRKPLRLSSPTAASQAGAEPGLRNYEARTALQLAQQAASLLKKASARKDPTPAEDVPRGDPCEREAVLSMLDDAGKRQWAIVNMGGDNDGRLAKVTTVGADGLRRAIVDDSAPSARRPYYQSGAMRVVTLHSWQLRRAPPPGEGETEWPMTTRFTCAQLGCTRCADCRVGDGR